MSEIVDQSLNEAHVLLTEFFQEYGQDALGTAIRCYRMANDLEAEGFPEEAERLRLRIQVLVDEGQIKLKHDGIEHAKKLVWFFLGLFLPKIGKGS